MQAIVDAVTALARNPFIGRPVATARRPLRELVSSFGKTGYLALYRIRRGPVEVLAVRHQREAGSSEG